MPDFESAQKTVLETYQRTHMGEIFVSEEKYEIYTSQAQFLTVTCHYNLRNNIFVM